ncbi:MAG: hypothetical protein RSB67_03225 [Clostridia bacterium]
MKKVKNEKKDEIDILEYIYQIAKMNQENVGRILNLRCIEDQIEVLLKEKLNSYKKIAYSARSMLIRRKRKVKDITIATKMATYLSVKKELLKDSSSKKIIQLLYEASIVSKEELNRYMSFVQINSKTILNICNRLLSYENNNILGYKKILNR